MSDSKTKWGYSLKAPNIRGTAEANSVCISLQMAKQI